PPATRLAPSKEDCCCRPERQCPQCGHSARITTTKTDRERSWNHRQLHRLVPAFVKLHQLSTIFIGTDKVGILPCSGLDVFPSKQLVVARRNASHLKAAGTVGTRDLVEIGAMSVPNVRDENDGSV